MTICNQRGGTLLGLMVGVLVSVLVAVAVAVYVARIPVPFVDRVSSDKDTSALDAQQSGDWNPNATLGGSLLLHPDDKNQELTRGSVVPAPDAALIPDLGEGGASAALQPLPAPAEVPFGGDSDRQMAQPDDVAQDPAHPAGDPLGDLVAARTQPPQAPAPATRAGDPFVYFVQAGAFRTAQDADAQRARLSLAGVHARVTQREQAGRVVYRVRVGPFDERNAADTILAQLSQGGFDAALVRVQR